MPKRRITLNLSPKADLALQALQTRNGDGITDAVNEAIRLYDFLTRVPGVRLYVECPPDYVPERVHLL